ncbi:MAG: response regulator, partial [Alcanivorax sp.]
ILLPGLNGLELLNALRQQSSVPVIVVSALGDEQARIQGLINGADDYLPKPFSMAELAVRVDAVCAGTGASGRAAMGISG